MSNGSRIAKNAVALYAAELLARALTLALNLLIARKLGSAEFGKYAYVASLMAIATIAADFGLSLLAVKEIAIDKGQTSRLAGQVFALKAIISLLIAAPLAFVAAGSETAVGQLLALNLLSLLILSYSTTVSSVLRAHQMMEYDGVNRVGMALIMGSAGTFLVLSGYGIVALGFVAVASAVMSNAFMALVARRHSLQPGRPSLRWHEMRDLLRRAWPFAVLVLLVTISFRIDMIMLNFFKTPDVVGQYSAAYKLIEVLLLIPGIFGTVLLPAMSERFQTARESLARLTQSAIKFFGVLVFPLAIGLITLAGPIIQLLYGDQFPDSRLALQILALALIPTFITAITSTLINASHRPQVNTYLAGIMAAFNIIANIFLIPRFSLFGAAFNTVLTESLGLVLSTVFIGRTIFGLDYHKVLWKPLLCGLAMGAVIVPFPRLWLIPVYGLVYGTLLWWTKSVDRAELAVFKQFLPRNLAGIFE